MASALQLADASVGACLVGSAVLAWSRRPSSRVGLLLGLAGATWFAGSVIGSALFVHRGPLVHLHLAYPTGRLRGWPSRITVLAAYVTAGVHAWARNDPLTIAVAGLVAATAAGVFIPTLGPARRALLPALGAALAFSAVLAVAAATRLAGWDIAESMRWSYFAVVAAVAIVLTVDLLRGRWADAVVTGLVIDLGTRSGAGALRTVIGRAIGDRTLTIGYWLADEGRFADDTGTTVHVENLPAGRATTPIVDRDVPLAVLVHDDAVLDDPKHVEAVAAATRLAVSSARLKLEAETRIEQVAASRRRIVVAADSQRRRLERELRCGTQAKLDRVAALLNDSVARATGPMAAELAALMDELRQAAVELDDLAQGIHPQALVTGGLGAALPALAARAGLPVHVDVDPGELPEAIAAAVYFVCSEAIANTAKHAEATEVSVEVIRWPQEVVAQISDNGVGGADPERGTGLRGLADRVESFGGTLSIDSPPGRGSRVRVVIPIAGADR